MPATTEEKDTLAYAWITRVSMNDFRRIVSGYKPAELRDLRDYLVDKYRTMTSQQLEPMEVKTNRDGTPMTKPQYEDWLFRAGDAQRHTLNQLGVVNDRIVRVGFIGALPTRTVLESLYRMATNVGPENSDDDNLLRLVKHHLAKETDS